MSRLLTVILNWRTADLTLRALAAVLDEVRSFHASRVCVVDNDSRDGSFEKISAAVEERGFGDVVDVVQSGRNGGFGFGNNTALRRALTGRDPPDYFYLLNSDARCDEGAVATLMKYLDEHPRTGIAGSYLHSFAGVGRESCFRFPSVLGELERSARLRFVSSLLRGRATVLPMPTRTCSVDWVAGASMMIRRSLVENIGLFDEKFFLYYEETDLCLRAKRAGFSVDYVRESSVAHIGGASTGVQTQSVPPTRLPQYVFDSRRHYFLKNHGRAALWAANLALFVGGGSFRVRRRMQNKPDPERPREWLDGVVHSVLHP
jgi:GT2 family glycosyltransferase